MSDIAQLNLKEPEQLDYDNAFKSSKYEAPPPAIGVDGKHITYYGQVVDAKPSEPDQGYLNYQLELRFVKSGSVDGRQIRSWASTRPFQKRNAEGELENIKGNPNALAKFLRSAGLQAKPQTNEQYVASVRAVNGKAIPFTIDWEAKSQDKTEVVRGYNNFPNDPDRPGMKKSILRKGDVYTVSDKKGNIIETKTVEADVMFANPRIQYFLDPTPKVGR